METNTFIGFCPSNGQPVLQQNINGEILCLHADTREQELKDMVNFFQQTYPYISLSVDNQYTLMRYLKNKIFRLEDNILDLMKDYILSQQNPEIDE
jgi:Lhr-like helicase